MQRRARAIYPAEPFLNVSVDVFYVVLSFLHPVDLLHLSAVSSAARASVSDPSVWRPLVHAPWPIGCLHDHDWKRVYCTRIKRALAGARFMCTFCACTRAFKQDDVLAAHTAAHTQSRQQTVHSCTVVGCGLSFDTQRRLHYHVKRHNSGVMERRQHACNWPGCTLTFPTPYALSLHRCRHTGAKRPHACKQAGCTRSFNSRHALALHADTHNARGERAQSFACAVAECGKVYMSKGALSKHGVKAHGEAVRRAVAADRIECGVDGCKRAFHYRSEWQTHMRRKHSRQAVEKARGTKVEGGVDARVH